MKDLDENFARRIAHDFNNVLMAISPFAELISRSPGNSRVAEYANRIREAVGRGKEVTRELLARREETEVVSDVQAVLERIARESAFGAKLHLRTPRERVIGAIDDEAFRQLTADILSYFFGKGQATRVFVSAETSLDLGYSKAQEAETSAHRLAHVKFRSQRTEPSGAHPTVEMAGEIARVRGGRILAEEADDGTVIHVFLPCAEAAAVDTSVILDGVTPPMERVLIVEDDDLVATGLVELLLAAGIRAEVAATPPEAMAAIEWFNPEAVILDIHLGEFDGTAIYRQIAARFPAMPVVFSTGHASVADFTWLDQPHVRLLQKPYTAETLIDCLHRAVAAARGSLT